MSRDLKRRLDKAATRVAALKHPFTEEENRQWAERQLEEVIREFDLSRDEAIECAKEHAPTLAEFLGVK